MNTIEIQKRFEQEVYWCQLTYQMLDEVIFPPDRKYILEPAKEVFNRLYTILVDYLCMRIIRFFDPAEQYGRENFSLKHFMSAPAQINPSEDDLKALKNYRNRHLSHNDLESSYNDFPSYAGLKKSIESLLKTLHDNLDILRRQNGCNADRSRDIASQHHSDFIQLISYGAFLHSKWKDPEYRDVIQDCIQWHQCKRQQV